MTALGKIDIFLAMKKTRIKLSEIERLGALQCTENEAASWLKLRRTAFRKLLQTDPQVREAWERGKDRGCLSLRRKQFRLAKTNATMAIFLGKNYLKQREVVVNEHSGPEGKPLEIDLGQLTSEQRNELRDLLTRASRSKSDTE